MVKIFIQETKFTNDIYKETSKEQEKLYPGMSQTYKLFYRGTQQRPL